MLIALQITVSTVHRPFALFGLPGSEFIAHAMQFRHNKAPAGTLKHFIKFLANTSLFRASQWPL